MVQTIVISGVDEGTRIDNLRISLKREQQIILRDLVSDVPDEINKISDSTDKLIGYMETLDGVLLICTEKISRILTDKIEDEQTEFEIDVSGETTKIRASRLQEKINESEDLKRKILVLRMPGVLGDVPQVIPESQVIQLPEKYEEGGDEAIKTIFDYWAKSCILGRLLALKKRNKFISVDSVDVK